MCVCVCVRARYLSEVVPQVTVNDFVEQMLLLVQELTDLVAGERASDRKTEREKTEIFITNALIHLYYHRYAD